MLQKINLIQKTFFSSDPLSRMKHLIHLKKIRYSEYFPAKSAKTVFRTTYEIQETVDVNYFL